MGAGIKTTPKFCLKKKKSQTKVLATFHIQNKSDVLVSKSSPFTFFVRSDSMAGCRHNLPTLTSFLHSSIFEEKY